ncbi:MAG: nucleolar RNA-binding Nop10p family protein [Candidatus Woesearchaeota archaeon]
MSNAIMFCEKCKKYTMNDICSCKNKTVHRKPPKYSPEDPYGEYRRKAKKEKGLL